MKPITEATPDLIGKYVNRYLWTDSFPVGKIIGIKSKTTVILARVTAGKNKTKMEMIPGGFAAHTVNNYSQEYDFEVDMDDTFTHRLSKKAWKNGFKVSDKPSKFHDYNF